MVILILVLVPLVALLYTLVQKTKQSRTTRGLYPPGPPGLPFLGNLLHQFNASIPPHIHLWQLSKKYGPLMSLKLGSVPLVVVSSPKIAKQVLKTHDSVFSSRPKVLGQHKLSYSGSDIGFAPYSESWRELRKICVVHLLSNKRVQSFRSIREEEVFRMIDCIIAASSSGHHHQGINLNTTVLSLTSNLICRIAFGKTHHKKVVHELMVESQAMQAGFFFSDYLPWFGWLDKLTGMIDRLDKNFNDLDEFYNELIDDHLNPSRANSSNPDILDLLIQLKQDNLCSIDLTWNQVKAILMNIFVAGTDTAAVTIVWTMTALMKNTNVMRKLQCDIRGLVGEKGRVNEDDLPKLLYLKAVVKEALRLYPPTPLLLPRETMEECVVEGYTIPPKTWVFINALAIARDPEYWENPEEFVPERFLNTGIDVMGQDFQVIPFGSGRRGCPGIAMGLANVELALANLLYSFDWELPKGMKQEDIDTDVLPGLTMHKKNPLWLVPKNYEYM